MLMCKNNVKKVLGYLFSLCGLIITQNLQAEPLYPKDTVIYYGNGVLTLLYDADIDRTYLRQKLQPTLTANGLTNYIKFKTAYNPTALKYINGTPNLGLGLLDIFEAVIQYLQLSSSEFWDHLKGSEPIPSVNKLFWLQQIANATPDVIDDSILFLNPAVREHIDTYNAALKECKRVVVVAHSQGNLFANMAYLDIEATLLEAFGIVSVASPYGSVADDGPYTIIEEDKVITNLPTSQSANVKNYVSDNYEPWHGHAFVGNYLADLHPAKEKIFEDIVDVIETLNSFNNSDYCGWPATYGYDYGLVREPYDKHLDSSGTYWESEIWDEVWQAARNNNLEVQYRLGRFGDWSTLNLRNLRTDYNYYHAGEGQPDAYQLTPFVYIDNGLPASASRFSKIIEVQPKDVDTGSGVPFGVQQYRLVIDGKVIDQFTLDYDQPAWLNPKTSRPIIDPLINGSNLIIAIPEFP